MSIEIVRGSSHKPAASDKLIEILSKPKEWSGQLFVGYPIIGTFKERYQVDALWISEEKGIVAFDLVEGYDADDYQFRQDVLANKLESRLRAHQELVERRELRIPIHTISFAPAVNGSVSTADDLPADWFRIDYRQARGLRVATV